MKLCFEIYYFDEDSFGFNVYFPKGRSFIILDEKATENDIALFIGSLLTFNELRLDEKFIKALHENDELALVGGLIFQQENTTIGPSCCADIQDWQSVVNGVHSQKTSWMGHNPTPWFEFKNESIILWSDEVGSEELVSIEYSQPEFERLADVLDSSIQQCMVIVEDWVNSNYKDAPDALFDGIKKYLLC